MSSFRRWFANAWRGAATHASRTLAVARAWTKEVAVPATLTTRARASELITRALGSSRSWSTDVALPLLKSGRARALEWLHRLLRAARSAWSWLSRYVATHAPRSFPRVTLPSPRTIRRTLSGLAIVLALGGTGMIAYPFATDLWANRVQTTLSAELSASAQEYRFGKIAVGEPLTRLEIPRLGVDVVIVEGTTPAALRAGAGHYPETALPGDSGNVAIAGHRTTYGRPFNRMDELKPGNRVILTTPIGKHVYEVMHKPWVVSPEDWSPITDYAANGSFLTLTSCHPEGSASHRIVVRAQLVESSNEITVGATGV